MSKKPRSKKLSPNAHIARKAAHMVKDMAIIYTLGMEPRILNLCTGRFVVLSDSMFHAFHDFRYKWTVYTAVMLETSLGEKYTSIRECSPEYPCNKDQIADTLKDAHIKHIKECKRMDLRNVGWVGFPKPCEASEKFIVQLLETNPYLWDEYDRGSFVIEESELTIEQQIANLL